MTTQPSRNTTPFVLGKAELTASAENGGPSSLVDRIFMLVAGALQERRLPAGARLPSIRQLADDCEISRDTTARAYDKLVAHGLIESRRGAGFFAKSGSPRREPAPQQRTRHFDARHSRMRFEIMHPRATLLSRAGSGVLPADWMAEDLIAGAVRAVARASQRGLADHGDAQGYLPLRQQLQLKLQDLGIQAGAAQIMVTGGASDAINLIVQALIRHREPRVLIERPCQPLLVDRLMSCGLDFGIVPRLADGPDLSALRAMCEAHRPKFFFCNSVLHNPTSGLMAPHKAFQILRLAEEFDLTLIEDDSYGDLMPATAAPAARLAPLDQLQRVIYLGSFSKTLAAGLRVGYLAANPATIEWLATYRSVNCIAGNSLAERAVYRLLSQGSYRHHCEQLRTRLADARSRLAQALRDMGLKLEHDPEAGMFLWADLGRGVNAMSIAWSLFEQGHLTAPGRVFSAAPGESSFMRFNVASTLDGPALPALSKMLGRG